MAEEIPFLVRHEFYSWLTRHTAAGSPAELTSWLAEQPKDKMIFEYRLIATEIFWFCANADKIHTGEIHL